MNQIWHSSTTMGVHHAVLQVSLNSHRSLMHLSCSRLAYDGSNGSLLCHLLGVFLPIEILESYDGFDGSLLCRLLGVFLPIEILESCTLSQQTGGPVSVEHVRPMHEHHEHLTADSSKPWFWTTPLTSPSTPAATMIQRCCVTDLGALSPGLLDLEVSPGRTTVCGIHQNHGHIGTSNQSLHEILCARPCNGTNAIRTDEDAELWPWKR